LIHIALSIPLLTFPFYRVAYTPIDSRLKFSEANRLLSNLKPSHLALPVQYTIPKTDPNEADCILPQNFLVSPLEEGQIREIKIKVFFSFFLFEKRKRKRGEKETDRAPFSVQREVLKRGFYHLGSPKISSQKILTGTKSLPSPEFFLQPTRNMKFFRPIPQKVNL